ncbi:hypothetical protein PIB30_035468 [Stylosanthes scabra]|uniref:Uncharacterized protein n=1 Tax=Stylosanthes scabra TaxID=79078 RepID=A0ABU6VF20_9FABA|nr:hypothetical protein [Stylosanthes scabra]
MYHPLVCINVTLVREFYANFSSGEQKTVFLRGKRIPFTEEAIRCHLGIRIDLPYIGVDDVFVATTKTYDDGNLNMADVFSVIGQEDRDVLPLRRLEGKASQGLQRLGDTTQVATSKTAGRSASTGPARRARAASSSLRSPFYFCSAYHRPLLSADSETFREAGASVATSGSPDR